MPSSKREAMNEHIVRVLVGPEQREFAVHKKLLCASSAFFRDSLDAVPEGLLSPSRPPPRGEQRQEAPSVLWLAGESAGMFELFVLWLYRRQSFRSLIGEALTILTSRRAEGEETIDDEDEEDDFVVRPPPCSSSTSSSFKQNTPGQCCSDLHWNLVRLHLFAALVDLPALQDVVMDALQDMYLRFDWQATPVFVQFLYGNECDPFAAFRLRRWAVALLAWTLSNRLEDEPEPTDFYRLFREQPQLLADFDAHLTKMAASHADARVKNPQLRLASNHLRSDDRHFGFRQCSFHSHRRAVGQGPCPHSPPREQAIVGLPGCLPRSLSSAKKNNKKKNDDNKNNNTTNTTTKSHQHTRNHSEAPSACSSVASSCAEPRRVDVPRWSPHSVTTAGVAPLGMESTI